MTRQGSKEIPAPPAGCTDAEWQAHLEREAALALAEGYDRMHYDAGTHRADLVLGRAEIPLDQRLRAAGHPMLPGFSS